MQAPGRSIYLVLIWQEVISERQEIIYPKYLLFVLRCCFTRNFFFHLDFSLISFEICSCWCDRKIRSFFFLINVLWKTEKKTFACYNEKSVDVLKRIFLYDIVYHSRTRFVTYTFVSLLRISGYEKGKKKTSF